MSEQQLEKLGTIRDWLQDNLPDKRLGTLVHNDFKLDNMLINEESLTVNGVVDWDMCTVGDPSTSWPFYWLTGAIRTTSLPTTSSAVCQKKPKAGGRETKSLRIFQAHRFRKSGPEFLLVAYLNTATLWFMRSLMRCFHAQGNFRRHSLRKNVS